MSAKKKKKETVQKKVACVATQIWRKKKPIIQALWEHAGCDGTPKCVAVPGAAACQRGVVLPVAPTCPETGGVQIEQGEHQAPHQEF